MAGSGLCCGSLEEPKALMKMGLSAIMVGHVNFLLGALVHGVVLRHINQHRQARAMLYSISNVVALTSGMVGVIVGILAIVLSKNKKSRSLTWSLFSFGLVSAIMSVASAVGLFIAMVRAIINNGRSLLKHCRFPDAIGYSSVTNECPFDPTRIYSTTLILWVPLIIMCIVQLVFSARCSAACASFLGLPCCPRRKKSPPHIRPSNVGKPLQEVHHSHHTDHLGSHSELAQPFTEHRHHKKPARANTEPSRTHAEPKKPYADQPRTSHKPVKPYTDRPQTPPKPVKSYTDRPQTPPNPVKSYTDRPQTPPKPVKPYTDRPQTPPKPVKPYTDRPQTPNKPVKSYMDRPETPIKPTKSYRDHPGAHDGPQRHASAPPRQYRPPPQPLPHQHHSLPQSERPQQHRERPERRTGSHPRKPEEDRLLQRAAPERSSFWI
ncbi:Transmembrane protein 54 [Oryzias melastigma]|uniref:Transmembrane protein 54 n=1 Tax=Oryzias melastigma TaxID=30732 RepID=A0A834FD34_ORYME|nr:Transmembrane protein 54 [Oryzias melastigma]